MYTMVGMSGVASRKNRIIWMLEEVGVEYEVIDTVPQSDIALSVNPTGVLPALRIGDDIITDSAAICKHLADIHPEKKLSYPSGTVERAEMEAWVHFAASDVEGPLWSALRQQLYVPVDKRRPQVTEQALEDWEKTIIGFGKRLGDQEYVMQGHFTVPDLILGHLGFWAKYYDFPVPSSVVSAYFDRMMDRPAFKKAIADDGITYPKAA